MNKNLLIGIIAGVVIAGGAFYFIGKQGGGMEENSEVMGTTQQRTVVSGAPSRKPGQGSNRSSLKGQKLSATPFASNAVLIYPGQLSSNAKAALVGFNLTTKTMADGSTQVSLTPTESGYTAQKYTVKSGQSLYFVEMNHRDDASGTTDMNKRDDFAVVVNQNGMIQ